MSDDVLNQSNSIAMSNEQREGYISHNRVNDIVADRLARQEEKLRKHHEEEIGKLKSSLPSEEAIAARVRAELEAQYKKSLEEQQNTMLQTQFNQDKSKYQALVKDVKMDPEEDECGLFTQEGERKYLPLQIAAGNFNMENTPEIMKELARNPHKLIQANVAAEKGDWAAVKAMFKKISNSMKTNQVALESRSGVAEPLSHLKPSTGGSSYREMSLADYKKDPSLRG